MRHVYIDPSAWVKRYYHETGTALTNQLFDRLLRSRPSRLLCSRMGMLEVVAVLPRHRNAGRVTQSLFNAAYALHLQVALEVHSQLHRQGYALLFFAADRRLLRTAQAEGLAIFNPEVGTSAQLESLLS